MGGLRLKGLFTHPTLSDCCSEELTVTVRRGAIRPSQDSPRGGPPEQPPRPLLNSWLGAAPVLGALLGTACIRPWVARIRDEGELESAVQMTREACACRALSDKSA